VRRHRITVRLKPDTTYGEMIMRRSSSLVGLAVCVVVAVTPWSTVSAADDRALVEASRVAQNRAIAAGDLNLVASFWTEDVTVRRALGHPLAGRDAALEALKPVGPPASRLVYQRLTKEIDVSPNWPLAFETGTWEGHQGGPTGPTIIGGRYSAQWVKRGDRWLIRSEVFVALTCSGAGCQSAAVP
jgi:ketosteroid isomerase-like protein